MAAWLSEHPLIFMPRTKEPAFFCTDIVPHRERSITKYERLFIDAKPYHRAIGEASTSYLYSRVAIDNILKYTNKPTFVVMIRSPVDMAVSLHEEMIYQGDEHVRSFPLAWSLQEQRERGEAVSRFCQDPQLLQYGSVCKLGEQLERLFRKVARHQVCVVVLDDLRECPAQEYRRVLKALKLRDDHRQEFPALNRSKIRRTQTLVRLRRRLGRFRERAGLPSDWFLGIRRWISSLDTIAHTREPLTPQMKAELQEYFRRDVEKLSILLQRDLTYWVENN